MSSTTGSHDKEVNHLNDQVITRSSTDEKNVGADEVDLAPVTHLADPDHGKTDAERATIVRLPSLPFTGTH